MGIQICINSQSQMRGLRSSCILKFGVRGLVATQNKSGLLLCVFASHISKIMNKSNFEPIQTETWYLQGWKRYRGIL